MAVDGTGLVHIAGATWSADFLDSGGGPAPPGLVPLGVSTPSGGCDAFVVTLDTVADTEWHTLLGGTGDDRANGLAVDPSGSIYVVGTTSSSGFPNSGNLPFAGGSDAFVAKFGELGTPNRLRFLTQPTNVLRLLPFAPAVQVEVLDAVGQRVTTAGNTITLALTTTPSTGLYGTRTVAAVNGVATFPDLRVSRLGKGQTLTASAAGLIGATSDPFDVVTAVPVRLRMLQEPSSAAAGQAITPAVQVEVVDALGRRVTNGTHAVRMGLYINRTRAPFTNFTTGGAHSFGGEYLELEENRKLVYTDRFDDPNLPGEIKVTVELTEVFCGTDLKIVQTGIPEMIPEAACYLGWQESLSQLANLVEPEIREG